MEIKVEVIAERFANTYLIGTSKELVIIDPAVSTKSIFQMHQKYFPEAIVKAILLTHGHYDHFVGLSELITKYPVSVYATSNTIKKLNNLTLSCADLFGQNYLPVVQAEYETIHHLSKIKFDTMEIEVLATPGHTNCSVCYLVEQMLFSGDTLFLNGVGRTDLPTGNSLELNKSLQFLLERLPDLKVFPGHGNQTTIYQEKKENYYYKKCIKF